MLIFNGKNLEDFNVTAIGRGTYGAPARDVEVVHVPGRNGDVIFDNGGFLNAKVIYPDCCIEGNFSANFRALRNFLLQNPGYCKLEDSYHPDEYRMARFVGPIDPDVHTARNNDSGVFSLEFDCQPQRWLKSGEDIVEIPILHYNNGTYSVRLWFTDTTRPHAVAVDHSGMLTVTCSGTTETYSSGTSTFTVPAGYSYEYTDLECDGFIYAVRYDTTDVEFASPGHRINIPAAAITVGGEYDARPEWRIVPDDSIFCLTLLDGSDRSAAMQYVQTEIDTTDTGYRFTIDTENYTARCGATNSPSTMDALSAVSGDLPILKPGRVIIEALKRTGLTYSQLPAAARVQVIPKTWRL